MSRVDALREHYRRLPDAALLRLVTEADGLEADAVGLLAAELAARGLQIDGVDATPEEMEGQGWQRRRVERNQTIGVALAFGAAYGFAYVLDAWSEFEGIRDPLLWGTLGRAILHLTVLSLAAGLIWGGARRGLRRLRQKLR